MIMGLMVKQWIWHDKQRDQKTIKKKRFDWITFINYDFAYKTLNDGTSKRSQKTGEINNGQNSDTQLTSYE